MNGWYYYSYTHLFCTAYQNYWQPLLKKCLKKCVGVWGVHKGDFVVGCFNRTLIMREIKSLFEVNLLFKIK